MRSIEGSGMSVENSSWYDHKLPLDKKELLGLMNNNLFLKILLLQIDY